jgi:hypothetical protein
MISTLHLLIILGKYGNKQEPFPVQGREMVADYFQEI